MTGMPAGRCGNDPRTILSDGDQAAVTEFREYLIARRTVERVAALCDQWQGRDLVPAGRQLLAELTAALAGTPAVSAAAPPVVRTRLINVTGHIEGFRWWCSGCRAKASQPLPSQFAAYQDAERDHPYCTADLLAGLAHEQDATHEQAPDA